jgi:aminoglycoside phosphotransferase (APT) family kinase protein
MQQEGRVFFERSADLDAYWASEPQTVLHGDPHFGNLWFEGDKPGFLDWQVAIAGAGVRDVAYFTTLSVDTDLRREIEHGLVERYAARLDAAGVEADVDHLWTVFRAGATEAYLSAVASAEAGDRAQDPEICRLGVERSVAAISDHDSFGVLAALVDGKRV